MTADDLVPRLIEWLAWLATEGRVYVFIGLMSIFLAAFVVAMLKRQAPDEDAPPVFAPPRRAPMPDEPGWRSEAQLAAVMLEAGRALEAVQAYRRLLELDPADPDALFNLGHAYFRLRLYGQARACWRAVRRLEPAAADARSNLRLVARLLKAEEAQRRRPSRSAERMRALAGSEGASELPATEGG